MPTRPFIENWLEWDMVTFTTDSPIVHAGDAFDIIVTFTGNKPIWNWFEVDAEAYELHFYAEGFGVAAPEMELGVVNGNLAIGGSPYTAVLHANISDVGVYRLACVLTFPDRVGVTGHMEGLLIQIY
jgi:hypothetical protein